MEYIIDTKELRKAMIDSGFKSITSLADEANVSRHTITSILNGKQRPSSTTIEALSVVLGLSGEDIGRIFFSQKLA